MKQITTKLAVKLVVICLCMLSCTQNKEHKYHTVIDKIKSESISSEKITVTSEVFNENVKTVTVNEDGYEFLIPDRKSQITSFNCSECHTEPVENLRQSQIGGKAAHWDIKVVHASEETMNCATCHTSNNMDNLHSITGSEIDFNYSYKLCSQCHQEEFKDWKGGAHGKQLGGWAPPRLSNTCVNCHNPHKPSFEKRWPVRFNTQKVKERQ